MSETYNDTIVEAIHKTRHEILARHGNNVSEYIAVASERRIPGVKYVEIKAYSNCRIPKAS